MTQFFNIRHITFIITILIALSQLSETIYTPSLPDMARDLGVHPSYTEYTLTIYLLGFAFGVLLWGTFSDYFGRRKGVILGLTIYVGSSLLCWCTKDIDLLYLYRFIQAFGASVGSVLGQAIARDSIPPEDRGRVYSTISMVMALSPAIGPLIGAMTVQYFHWSYVFLLLVGLGALIMSVVFYKLPETNIHTQNNQLSLLLYKDCIQEMARNRRVWGFAILIGLVNGIIFGYFAESPFYFVEALNMPRAVFGFLSLFVCVPLFVGGWISRKLNSQKIQQDVIVFHGVVAITLSGMMYVIITYYNFIIPSNKLISSFISILCISCVMTGNAIIIPNCFSQALEPFGRFVGTSASLFGFTYYIIISFFTGVMGWLHDGSIFPMPVFMLGSGMLMLITYMILINPRKTLLPIGS